MLRAEGMNAYNSAPGFSMLPTVSAALQDMGYMLRGVRTRITPDTTLLSAQHDVAFDNAESFMRSACTATNAAIAGLDRLVECFLEHGSFVELPVDEGFLANRVGVTMAELQKLAESGYFEMRRHILHTFAVPTSKLAEQVDKMFSLTPASVTYH